jgi:hypothetical protein
VRGSEFRRRTPFREVQEHWAKHRQRSTADFRRKHKQALKRRRSW